MMSGVTFLSMKHNLNYPDRLPANCAIKIQNPDIVNQLRTQFPSAWPVGWHLNKKTLPSLFQFCIAVQSRRSNSHPHDYITPLPQNNSSTLFSFIHGNQKHINTICQSSTVLLHELLQLHLVPAMFNRKGLLLNWPFTA